MLHSSGAWRLPPDNSNHVLLVAFVITRVTDFARKEGGVASRVKKREGGGGVVQGRRVDGICHTLGWAFATPISGRQPEVILHTGRYAGIL